MSDFKVPPSDRVYSACVSGSNVCELEHTWMIKSYNFIKGYETERFNSPAFKFFNHEWFIQFYPHGTSDTPGMVAIFVIGKDLPNTDSIYVHIQFTIVNQKDQSKSVKPQSYYYILSSKNTKHNHTNSGGHINVLNEKELHKPSSGFIGEDGTLKIILNFKITSLDPSHRPEPDPPVQSDCYTLANNLQTLLRTGIHSDCDLYIENTADSSTENSLFPSRTSQDDSKSPTEVGEDSSDSCITAQNSQVGLGPTLSATNKPRVVAKSSTISPSASAASPSQSSNQVPNTNSVPPTTPTRTPTAPTRSPSQSPTRIISHSNQQQPHIAKPERLDGTKSPHRDRHSSVRHVHKCILSARSPYFKAMFQQNMQENTQNFVILNDISDEAVSGLLDYVYCDTIPSVSVAAELLVAADKYQMNGLGKICQQVLINNLQLDGSFGLLLLADRYPNCAKLRREIIQFLSRNIPHILKSPEFATFMTSKPNIATEIMMSAAEFYDSKKRPHSEISQ